MFYDLQSLVKYGVIFFLANVLICCFLFCSRPEGRLSGEVVKNQKSALQLFTSCSPRPSLSVTIRKPHFVATFCAKCTATISAQRVWFFNIGSGRVSEKIPVSGWSSGRVGVSKFTIGYFRVSFLLSGISGYFGYFRVCRVFSGISGFTHVYTDRVIF